MRAIVNRVNKGFSIMELIAVLLIVSALVAMALPTYENYTVRSELAIVLKVLEELLLVAEEGYISSGAVPTTVLGITAGAFSAYGNSPYIDYIYYDDGAAWSNTGAMVQAVVSSEVGSSISGFVAGTSGTNNTLTLAFVVDGDNLQTYCGVWANDGTGVPTEYLINGCNELYFSSTVTG